jgi:surface protein
LDDLYHGLTNLNEDLSHWNTSKVNDVSVLMRRIQR